MKTKPIAIVRQLGCKATNEALEKAGYIVVPVLDTTDVVIPHQTMVWRCRVFGHKWFARSQELVITPVLGREQPVEIIETHHESLPFCTRCGVPNPYPKP